MYSEYTHIHQSTHRAEIWFDEKGRLFEKPGRGFQSVDEHPRPLGVIVQHWKSEAAFLHGLAVAPWRIGRYRHNVHQLRLFRLGWWK